MILMKSGSNTPKSVSKNIRAALLLHCSSVKDEITKMKKNFNLTTNESDTNMERTVNSLEASGSVFPLNAKSDGPPSVRTPSPRRRKSKRKSNESDQEQWFETPDGKDHFDYYSYNQARLKVPVESRVFFRNNVLSRKLVPCSERTLCQ